jgi:hypothetical protein
LLGQLTLRVNALFKQGVAEMSQITLYLDDATQALVDQAAQANGVSKSRWVADIIRKYAAHEWPQDCLALAGRWWNGHTRAGAAAKKTRINTLLKNVRCNG